MIMDDVKINVGLEILCARIEEGMTQRQLAQRMKTKQSSVSRVERGAVAPTISFLYKIAGALRRKLLIAFIPDDPRINSVGTQTITHYQQVY